MDLLYVRKSLNGITRFVFTRSACNFHNGSKVSLKLQTLQYAPYIKASAYPHSNILKASQYNKSVGALSRPRFAPFNFHYDFSPNRGLHTSCELWDKSKVEDSLKQKKGGKVVPDEKTVDKPEKTIVKPSMTKRIVAELKHYYNGFRLLFLDVRIGAGTVWKYLNGKPVMRREHRQFTRAVSDIFRLAPFSVFIIIPLAEFALPLALKFFPNMLPSTFETSSTRETRLKKELAVKLEMSKFLQDAMEDIAVRAQKSANKTESAQDFYSFIEQIRENKEQPSNEEIMKHAKYFETELTLNNLTRGQLMALCKLLQIPAVGNNAALRLMLDLKLSSLYADDKMISEEGITSLTTEELVSACQERGMRALGLSRARLEVQLSEWIDLHLNSEVSASLLLISRILYLPENVPPIHRIKEAISTLSENTAEEAKVRVAEINLERVDNTSRYKAAKQEQDLIVAEKTEEAVAKVDDKKGPEDPVVKKSSETGKSVETITQDDIDVLVRAMMNASKDMTTLKDAKLELRDLQQDMDEYRDDVKNLKSHLAADSDGLMKGDTKASKRITAKLMKLVERMKTIIVDLEDQQETNKDTKEMYMISFQDMVDSMSKLESIPVERLLAVFETLDTNKDGKIDISEARRVIHTLNAEDVEMTPQQLALVVALFSKREEMFKSEQNKTEEEQQRPS